VEKGNRHSGYEDEGMYNTLHPNTFLPVAASTGLHKSLSLREYLQGREGSTPDVSVSLIATSECALFILCGH
jgi:hypothetical protein